jgi:lysophospholipase L1-like esterase
MKIQLIRLIAVMLIVLPAAVAVGAQIKIMPLGDSITHGGSNGDASYRVALFNNLTDNGIDFTFVGSMTSVWSESSANPNPLIYPEYFADGFPKNHEGHAGWTTGQIATDAGVANSIASNKPDVVVLHIGTNDLGRQLISASNGYQPAMTNLDTIVSKLRAANPNVKIVLAQLIPYKPTAYNNDSYTQIEGYNARMAVGAAARSTQASPILMVDQYTGFDVYADHTVDGLHPNQYGEQKMADRFYMAIRQLTNPDARILCPLHVNNASFEDGTPVADNTPSYSFGGKGWVFHRVSNGAAGSDCGFGNLGSNVYTGAAGDGTPLGGQGKGALFFYNRPGTTQDDLSWVSQTIGGFLQDHMEYSLSIAVGKRLNGLFAGAKIELLAGDTVIASRILDAAASILAGQFTDVSMAVNSDALNQQLLGEFLTIRLSPLSGTEFASVEFDNIRLTSVQIPEPASIATMIAAVVFIAPKRRRHSSKNT